jgi:hypothetical protein
MEKVVSSGIRLMLLLLLVVSFSCGGKKSASTDAERIVVEDTSQVDTTAISNQEYSNAVEIFEYRSEALKNYQIYAVYPFQDAPQFIVVRNDMARLLILDEDSEAEEGQALKDEEFVAVKFLEELGGDGITTFGQIELTTRNDLNVIFNQSQTKRSLTIGEQYAYTNTNDSGSFTLVPQGDEYSVAIQSGTGDHFCELESTVRIKGNLAYFQGKQSTAHCKLIFFFTDKKVQVLQISSNSDCACAAKGSLNQEFSMR